MYLFTFTFSNGSSRTVEVEEEKYANQLFTDMQSWMRKESNINIPESITIKTHKGCFYLIKIEELVTVYIDKMSNEDYKLVYGNQKH